MPDSTIIIKKTNNFNNAINIFKLFLINYFYWLVALISIAILVLGFVFLIKPKYDFIMSGKEIDIQKEAFIKKFNYLKKIEELNAYFGQTVTEADRQKIEQFLNINEIKHDAMLDFYWAAKNSGPDIKFNDYNVVEAPTSAEGKPKLLNFKGSSIRNELFDNIIIKIASFNLENIDYVGLINFLQIIEKNIRLMDVLTLDFDPKERKASLSVQMYQFIPPQTTPNTQTKN